MIIGRIPECIIIEAQTSQKIEEVEVRALLRMDSRQYQNRAYQVASIHNNNKESDPEPFATSPVATTFMVRQKP